MTGPAPPEASADEPSGPPFGPPPLHSRLAAIVSIDVAGFSRRTQRDPNGMVRDLARLRSLIDQAARAQGGRIFNTAGDGFMIEFPTASAACAGIDALRASLRPTDPQVRIGAHLGEVVVTEHSDLIGHGVNVAARLQALAEPGGALISQAMQAQLAKPKAQRFQHQGLVALNKMDDAHEVYALPRSGARLGRLGKYALKPRRAAVIVAVLGLFGVLGWQHWSARAARAEVPLVAVLPFTAIGSQGAAQDALALGLAEDILDALARSDGLQVIAPSSAFQVDSAAAALRELKASHLLEGSIRQDGQALRISARLSALNTNAVMWSASYDRTGTDMLGVQREIAAAVAGALAVELVKSDQANVPGTVDRASYQTYLEARALRRTRSQPAQAEAAALLRGVVAAAPAFAPAWTELASAQLALANIAHRDDGLGADALALRSAARTAAERALRLDPQTGQPYAVLAFLEPPQAFGARLALLDRGLQVEPMNPTLLRARGQLRGRLGYAAAALVDLEQAHALDPLDPLIAVNRIWVLELAGRPQEARVALAAALARWPSQQNVWSSAKLFAAMDRDISRLRAMLGPDAVRPAEVTREALRADAALADAIERPDPQRLMTLRSAAAAAAPDQTTGIQDTIILLALAGGPDAAFPFLSEQGPTLNRLNAASRAQTRGSPRSLTIGVDGFAGAAFAAVRADRRFADLMEVTGVAEHWRSTGVLPDFCTAAAAPPPSCAAITR